MSHDVKALIKEAGAAFAVLAIYVLTLLVPLHQASATQKSFAELGYETFGEWSICTAITDAESGEDMPAAMNCPVTGVSKQLALDTGVLPVSDTFAIATVVTFDAAPRAPPQIAVYQKANPRAPPMHV